MGFGIVLNHSTSSHYLTLPCTEYFTNHTKACIKNKVESVQLGQSLNFILSFQFLPLCKGEASVAWVSWRGECVGGPVKVYTLAFELPIYQNRLISIVSKPIRTRLCIFDVKTNCFILRVILVRLFSLNQANLSQFGQFS